MKVIEERDLKEKKIQLFLEDESIGVEYSSIKEFIKEQENVGEADEDKVRGHGYGFSKNYEKYEDVDEEELYKKLREL